LVLNVLAPEELYVQVLPLWVKHEKVHSY